MTLQPEEPAGRWCGWGNCGNRPRYRAADGRLICGRHLRYVARPITELTRESLG